MLNRYRHKKEGEYSHRELSDIYMVSHFLHHKVLCNDKDITQLEKDYINYCKNVFWHETKYTTLASCISFLLVDSIYPISRLSLFPRIIIKFASARFIFNQGTDSAFKEILKFPLMNEVIGEAIIRYTEWIDISE